MSGEDPSAQATPTVARRTLGSIGFLVYHTLVWVLSKLGIDDPVSAFPIHGGCGFWGLLASGFFQDSALSGATSWGAQLRNQFAARPRGEPKRPFGGSHSPYGFERWIIVRKVTLSFADCFGFLAPGNCFDSCHGPGNGRTVKGGMTVWGGGYVFSSSVGTF